MGNKVTERYSYNQKPKMILFDVGGTLFDDSKCIPYDGLEALRLAAKNPDITSGEKLTQIWEEYMAETSTGHKSNSGTILDFPLTAAIKYVTMQTGLKYDISINEQEEIFDRFNSSRKVIKGVPELLKAIDLLGIRTAVISNNAMSGEGLALAVKHWIPEEKMEFFLTSADILLTKPSSNIFTAAANFAGLCTAECWYCGDSKIPDVDGARNAGMTPVLLDTSSELPSEMRTDGSNREYMAVNCWDILREHLLTL